MVAKAGIWNSKRTNNCSTTSPRNSNEWWQWTLSTTLSNLNQQTSTYYRWPTSINKRLLNNRRQQLIPHQQHYSTKTPWSHRHSLHPATEILTRLNQDTPLAPDQQDAIHKATQLEHQLRPRYTPDNSIRAQGDSNKIKHHKTPHTPSTIKIKNKHSPTVISI